jgi:hypothetical protein
MAPSLAGVWFRRSNLCYERDVKKKHFTCDWKEPRSFLLACSACFGVRLVIFRLRRFILLA